MNYLRLANVQAKVRGVINPNGYSIVVEAGA